MLDAGELSIPNFNQVAETFILEERVFCSHPSTLVAGKFETLPDKDDG